MKTTHQLLIPLTVLFGLNLLEWGLEWEWSATQFCIEFVVLSILLVLLYLFINRPMNMFVGSGNSPAAQHSYELKLKKRGGEGMGYFCEPDLSFARLSDFSYVQGPRISFEQLLHEKGSLISPYCVDDEHRQIVFVETEKSLDPAFVGPFYFQTQRKHAIALYTVPFDEYNSVCANLPVQDFKKLLLVYNTSRCGSTLLSKVLDNLAGVQSISEPDVFTSLAHIAQEAGKSRDKELIALARSSGRLMLYLRRQLHPERDIVALKFRFQTINIAPLLKEAMPDAKGMFLYRNGLDVVDSMGAAFINGGVWKIIRALCVDIFYVYHFSDLPSHLWKIIPMFLDSRFPVHSYKGLGAVSPLVMGWITCMDRAISAHKAGLIPIMIRYEDLITQKTALVREALKRSGIQMSQNSDDTSANAVFGKDAHANSSTASNRGFGESRKKEYSYLRAAEIAKINQVLARHDEIRTSDFIIPGTLQL